MPTIQQQINQLKKDKETLNTMLNTMGVETTGNETFTQLTPLVGKIVTDPILQDKTIEIKQEGIVNIVADEGYDGLNSVSINFKISNEDDISNYQLVQYIQTNSEAYNANYITTGIVANSNTSLEMKLRFHVDAQNYTNLYGGSNQLFKAQCATSGGTKTLCSWNGVYVVGAPDGMNAAFVLKQDKNKVYRGSTLVHTFNEATWQDTTPMKLFSEVGGNRDGKFRLYYCKIWDDGVLVRDYVACYRKSDGVIGLFDKVENKFYENEGTTAFSKGADITA